MYWDVFGFLVVTGLSHQQVDYSILLMFMEYLVQNGLSQSNVANYTADIRSQCIVYGQNTVHFQYQQTISKSFKN